jgi:hypothetical protein
VARIFGTLHEAVAAMGSRGSAAVKGKVEPV